MASCSNVMLSICNRHRQKSKERLDKEGVSICLDTSSEADLDSSECLPSVSGRVGKYKFVAPTRSRLPSGAEEGKERRRPEGSEDGGGCSIATPELKRELQCCVAR